MSSPARGGATFREPVPGVWSGLSWGTVTSGEVGPAGPEKAVTPGQRTRLGSAPTSCPDCDPAAWACLTCVQSSRPADGPPSDLHFGLADGPPRGPTTASSQHGCHWSCWNTGITFLSSPEGSWQPSRPGPCPSSVPPHHSISVGCLRPLWGPQGSSSLSLLGPDRDILILLTAQPSPSPFHLCVVPPTLSLLASSSLLWRSGSSRWDGRGRRPLVWPVLSSTVPCPASRRFSANVCAGNSVPRQRRGGRG